MNGDGSRKTGKLFYMGVLLMEKKNALLVTAEEAAKFSDFTFLDAIYMCFDVRKEMIKRMNKSLPCDGLIFNAIFTAGVIQGETGRTAAAETCRDETALNEFRSVQFSRSMLSVSLAA